MGWEETHKSHIKPCPSSSTQLETEITVASFSNSEGTNWGTLLEVVR